MRDKVLVDLPLELLQPHSKNELYFKNYTGDKWQLLLDSIRTDGILHALVVHKTEGQLPDAETYTVISGHQRLRAAKELELETVPCVVCESLDDITAERQLIATNHIQREYSLAEKYRLASRLIELSDSYSGKRNDLTCGQNAHRLKGTKTRDKIAKQVGLTDHDIKNITTLKQLPTEQQAEIWSWLDEQNPRKNDIKNRLADMKHKKQVAGKQIKKLRDENANLKKKLQSAKAHQLSVYSPEHEYINVIDNICTRGHAFFVEEIGRLRLGKAETEAVHALLKNNHLRMRMRGFLAQVEEYYLALEELFFDDMPTCVDASDVSQAVREKRENVRSRIIERHKEGCNEPTE